MLFILNTLLIESDTNHQVVSGCLGVHYFFPDVVLKKTNYQQTSGNMHRKKNKMKMTEFIHEHVNIVNSHKLREGICLGNPPYIQHCDQD